MRSCCAEACSSSCAAEDAARHGRSPRCQGARPAAPARDTTSAASHVEDDRSRKDCVGEILRVIPPSLARSPRRVTSSSQVFHRPRTLRKFWTPHPTIASEVDALQGPNVRARMQTRSAEPSGLGAASPINHPPSVPVGGQRQCLWQIAHLPPQSVGIRTLQSCAFPIRAFPTKRNVER